MTPVSNPGWANLVMNSPTKRYNLCCTLFSCFFERKSSVLKDFFDSFPRFFNTFSNIPKYYSVFTIRKFPQAVVAIPFSDFKEGISIGCLRLTVLFPKQPIWLNSQHVIWYSILLNYPYIFNETKIYHTAVR